MNADRALETSRRRAAVETLLSLGWKWNGERWDHPDANDARTFTFATLTAIRTGWTAKGIPCLAISENPNPDEPQSAGGLNATMNLGGDSVIIQIPSPEILFQLFQALSAISKRMAEHATAKRQ